MESISTGKSLTKKKRKTPHGKGKDGGMGTPKSRPGSGKKDLLQSPPGESSRPEGIFGGDKKGEKRNPGKKRGGGLPAR